MESDQGYLVPDFYEGFRCKCGDCRHCCCEGWGVGVTQEEYFRLLGLDCSPELRSRVQRAFYVPRDASPERFAMLNHDWQGNCPMRGADGLCILQAEQGEEALPSICRRYPRGIHPELGEAALSASCEGVVELLAARTAPLRFVNLALPLPVTGREDPARMALRLQCIGLLQDKRVTLRQSMDAVGRLITGADAAHLPFDALLPAMLGFAGFYKQISRNLADACARTLARLGDCTEQEYAARGDALAARFPRLEALLELLLANHFFFEKFPYSETRETEQEEYVSLCGLCGFLRVLLAGNAEELQSDEALTDLLSAAFRVLEHTSFHYNAHVLLCRCGFDDPAKAGALLRL